MSRIELVRLGLGLALVFGCMSPLDMTRELCVCDCVRGLLSSGSVTPPAQRVQSLLGRDEEDDDEDHQAHAMFCEMEELRPSGEDGEKEWKETAR